METHSVSMNINKLSCKYIKSFFIFTFLAIISTFKNARYVSA